ncbi:protoporphyrinogen oxidase isoform X2 [Sphaerodactylus townsendi]|uniref:protoporphyrinogen oxidase isoform X2 n=1 Tax=Sphaerodactylus townsendi TaxID=933632 RepID=UPI0020270718|nr:protoporphyrinogen oxidase isoform X2 [Sphaerodactylus townsendi]
MQRTVAVLGGGVSGLAACYYLARSPQAPKVILLEGSSRLGGWIHSTRTEDGAVFEHGPRGIRPAGAVGRNTLLMWHRPEGPAFYSSLGLERAQRPDGPPRLRGRREHPRLCEAPLWPRAGRHHHRLPLPGGVCWRLPGTEHALLLPSIIPSGEDTPVSHLRHDPWRRAQKERWSQWSLRNGMEALPEALADFLKHRAVEIHRDASVKRLDRTATGRWQISLEDGVVEADHVISALPAKALAKSLPNWAEPLSRELSAFSTVSVGVVNLQYKGVKLPVMGFGHLVPSFEDSSLLGVVYDSVAFPEQDGSRGPAVRLTVMLGGAWFTPSLGDPDTISDATLVNRARAAVKEQLGVSSEPSRTIVKVHKACIPQYTLGHWKNLETIANYLKERQLPLSLVGASYEGVSVNDCIFNSRKAVSSLLGESS